MTDSGGSEKDGYENQKEKRENLSDTFISQTTLHGFHFLFDSDTRVRRILWMCLLVASASFLFVQIATSLKKFLEYESVVSKHILIPERLPFPAISICNQNMLRQSQILGTDAQYYLDQMDPYMSVTKDKTNRTFDLRRILDEKGHQLSTMLKNCSFNGEPCGPKNFSSFYVFEFGRCYTFNSGKSGHPLLYGTDAGRLSGLKMTLDAEPDEYYGPFSYDGVGFRVLVSSQSEAEPKMDLFATLVSPGFNYEVPISKQELRKYSKRAILVQLTEQIDNRHFFPYVFYI